MNTTKVMKALPLKGSEHKNKNSPTVEKEVDITEVITAPPLWQESKAINETKETNSPTIMTWSKE